MKRIRALAEKSFCDDVFEKSYMVQTDPPPAAIADIDPV
jgi:hypothetical protein